tara:strand:+ start:983 stop:1168 length:186 start_codon:yes stop_codon:yes gene_type:complete
MTYIQLKSRFGLETIDQFDTRKEARLMLEEYRMAFGNDSIVYLSSRACKDYHSQNYREDIL